MKEKKSSNKKGSNFVNHGQRGKNKTNEKENGGDISDEEKDDSDDDSYKFSFLQQDLTCSIQNKVAIPKM